MSDHISENEDKVEQREASPVQEVSEPGFYVEVPGDPAEYESAEKLVQVITEMMQGKREPVKKKSCASFVKSVYDNGLLKHGFHRLKGPHLYYVRCVGDEIVHVIAIREERAYRTSYQGVYHIGFTVSFGAATVYRKKVTLDEPVRDNQFWLNNLDAISYMENYCSPYDRQARKMIPFRYEYAGADETALTAVVQRSLEMVEQYALPVLDRITDLDACMEYFFKYHPILLAIFEASDRYIDTQNKFNEGLLPTMLYGKERMAEYRDASEKVEEDVNADELYRINAGLCGFTLEQHEQNVAERKENLEEELKRFEILATDPAWKEKVRRELALRKQSNIALLRKLGVEI